jgi:hypothetical protein
MPTEAVAGWVLIFGAGTIEIKSKIKSKSAVEERGKRESGDLTHWSKGFATQKKILKNFAKAVDSGTRLPYFQTVIGP